MTSTIASLTELTLSELSDSLLAAASVSNVVDQSAWDLLTRLATELAEVPRNTILVDGRKWVLVALNVQGFRGARYPLDLHFDHAEGITVLHGENGSGKSSIAEALRMALEGRTGVTHLGESGHLHELWGNTDQRSRGSASAEVKVSLRDLASNDSLVITARLSETGVVREAELVAGSVRHTFNAESDAWLSWTEAIRTSPPVLAYAELADELQKKRDLHVWLTSCLAMDNAIRLFDSHVKEGNDSARIAANSISAAQKIAEASIHQVDSEWLRKGVENIASVVWEVHDNQLALDAWLTREELTSRELAEVELAHDARETIATYAITMKAALASWRNAATTSLTPEVESGIVELDDRVRESDQDNHDGVCPACGAAKIDWREHLHAQATRLESSRAAATVLKATVRDRFDSLLGPLRGCLTSLPSGFESPQTVQEVERLLSAVAEFDSETDDLSAELSAAILDLCIWAETADASGLMDVAIAAAGRRNQWLAHRWTAVAAYLDVWDRESEVALSYPDWKKAVSKWNSHLGEIRKQRSASLHSLVGPAVELLLGDVGISVASTKITKSEARLVLQNRLGELVDFSHLSAGQRNALILGPIIATAEGGIFGFTLLDDPVHAFDDFRVDQLSATLARMGKAQALILTTHDARFVEYLRVHASEEFTVYKAERNDVGQITLTETNAPWAELVKFADELLVASRKIPDNTAIPDIVALLRMSVDEALEGMSLRYIATLDATKGEEVRTSFGAIPTTNGRAKALRDYVSADAPKKATFSTSWNYVSTKLKTWSDAMHDKAVDLDNETVELHISDTRKACAGWAGIRWS